jgi:hypothetical protein
MNKNEVIEAAEEELEQHRAEQRYYEALSQKEADLLWDQRWGCQ